MTVTIVKSALIAAIQIATTTIVKLECPEYSAAGIFSGDFGQAMKRYECALSGLCEMREKDAMSLPHAKSGDIVSVKPLGLQLPQTLPHAIVRSAHLELIRTVLHAGKSVHEHKIDGEMVIQCIEGRIGVNAHGRRIVLEPGELLFLDGGVLHAMDAETDSSALLILSRAGDEQRH